jgi:signal transduction histidine kinase/ligand-binding sensor domain-containing protein
VNKRLATRDPSDSLDPLPSISRLYLRIASRPRPSTAGLPSPVPHTMSEVVAQFPRLVVGLLTLCALMVPTAVRAERLPLRVYSTADGLPSNQINCVKRDSHGFLWFCTAEGLSRFDGYTFTNYGVDQGLPDRFVTDFLETRSGEYWVGTARGLAQFNPKPGPKAPMFIRFGLGQEDLTVNELLEDRQGAIWVGTYGLFRLSRTGGRWAWARPEATLPTHDSAEYLFEDHTGKLWIAFYTGHDAKLYRRTPDGQVDVFQPAFFHENRIQSMLEDQRNRIWVGTYHGLALLLSNPKSGGPHIERVYTKRDGLGGDEVPGLFQSSDGRLWVGAGGTFQVLSDVTGQHVSFKRLMDPASISEEDREGNLWVGGTRLARNGLIRYDLGEGVHSVFEGSKGELYLAAGVHDRFIERFDGQRFIPVAPKVPGHDASWDWGGWGWGQIHFQDHTGEWWVPTGNGLLLYPKVTRLEDLAHTKPKATYKVEDGLAGNDIFRLYEDSRGDVWIGAWGGPTHLTRWERSTRRFHTFTTSEGWIDGEPTAFREDRAGDIWVGQWDWTLARFRRGQFTFFTKSDGFPEGTVFSIFSDHVGRLWAGTSRGGLVRIDDPSAEHPHFVVYTTKQGLSSNAVGAITEDHYGRIYFWTGRGVDRLQPNTGAIRHYTETDGLARSGAEQNVAFCDRHGALWFSLGELSRLDPEPDRPGAPPPIRITKVRIRGTEYPTSELGETDLSGLLLEPGQDEIQIEFASLNFAVGDVIKYQYKLEGADAAWGAPSDLRAVNYPRLSSGRYRFLVRAINADGLVSSTPAAVSFRLLPPVWRRWWFLSLVALLAASLIYRAYRFRLDRLLELERVRTRIATDLHDDVGSSLTQIAIMSEVARRQGAEVAEPLAQIAGLSRELVDSMGDIVWAINPKRDHLGDLAQRMRRFASDVLASNGTDLEFHTPVERADASLQSDLRREVFLVFKESINNIARHSHCKHVSVLLSLQGKQLVMRICDNGQGFLTKSGDGQGHGLASMRDRAQRLGGDLRVDSEPGKGTTITLTVPLP